MTKPSNQDLNVDIELRKGNQEILDQTMWWL